MRNVTEKKAEARGRGRPRKADALTNAQRQAAYRARRRQQSFTETEPAGKAAADHVRKELEAARAIIADLRAQKAGAELERDRVKKERDEARRAYELFQAGHVELAKYHDLTDTYHRIQGQLYEANHKLALAEEQARKFVTHNGNTKVTDILEMAVLEIACKRKTAKGRMQLYKSKSWSQVHTLALGQDLYRRFADCVHGPDFPPKKTAGAGEN